MMQQDKIIEFIKNCFNEGFPKFDIDRFLQVSGRTMSGSIATHSFEGTRFHFDFRNKKLLHFTSLNNLKSILESESLWGSNFNTFRDKNEMLLAAENIFNISDLEKRKAKDGLFALSLIELQDEKVKDSYHYHWREYGNDFKGVALELEIMRYSGIYYPLSVQYVKNIEEEEIIRKIKKCYNECFSDDVFNESIGCFLYPLFSAFKVPKYEEEKEVRIFHIKPNWGNLPQPAEKGSDCIKFYIDGNNEPVYYWNLPLGFPNDSKENPNYIRLNKIHIGKNAFDCNSNGNTTAEIICIHLNRLCNKKDVILV